MEQKYREQIALIRAKLQAGQITYEQAVKLAEPVIAELNTKANAIAAKHGKKPYKFTFNYLMRL